MEMSHHWAGFKSYNTQFYAEFFVVLKRGKWKFAIKILDMGSALRLQQMLNRARSMDFFGEQEISHFIQKRYYTDGHAGILPFQAVTTIRQEK